MSQSTWHNIINGLHAAVHESYTSKTGRQRRKREVQQVMRDVDGFCRRKQDELHAGDYMVGPYRHFRLKDKKKARDISVLPYEDRCVQNAVKDAIEPLLMRRMTDEMLGGLPGRGVLANARRHSVVQQMREAMGDESLTYYLQGDVSKFYDNIDNVVAMRLVERQVSDRRTLGLIRQHLFAQKQLAIGDPISHLVANMVMAGIIRKAKATYGKRVRLLNFADDFIAFARDKETLKSLRRDMRQWGAGERLHYKCMYVRPVDGGVTFCGMKYLRHAVHLTQRTKKRYIHARHRRRAVASYNGILEKADTKHLRKMIEQNDNRHMSQKIRRPFAGRPMKIDTIEGIQHTIVAVQEKPSRQQHSESYMHVQAIADGLGLIVYSTSSAKIVEYLRSQAMPVRNVRIVHDWSGFYFEGTVYTDAEEEDMIRKQFNIPK